MAVFSHLLIKRALRAPLAQGALIALLILLITAGTNAFVSHKEAAVIFGQPSGTVNTDDNLNESARTLDNPAGVVIDSSMNIFILDYDNNRVLKYNSTGLPPSDTIPDLVFGQAGFDTATAGGDSLSLNHPSGAAFDSLGSLWVADGGNDRLLRFDPTGASVTDTTPDLVLAVDSTPVAVKFDASGTMWVAHAGTTVISLYGADAAGQVTDTAADLILTAVGPATPINAADILFDAAGNLYIAEQTNNRVLRIPNLANNPRGDTTPDLIFGQPSLAVTDANTGVYGLDAPRGLALDPEGNLYISEMNNNRITRFDANVLGIVSDTEADALIGQTRFDTTLANNGGLSASSLSAPWDITFDEKGYAYIADAGNNRVLVLGPNPPILNLTDEAKMCFVATAAYGKESSSLRPLQYLRDHFLLESRWGRGAVELYYRHGPGLAQAPPFSYSLVKAGVRAALFPLVGFGRLMELLGMWGAFALLLAVFVSPSHLRRLWNHLKA